MILNLHIEASAAVLARVLAAIGSDDAVVSVLDAAQDHTVASGHVHSPPAPMMPAPAATMSAMTAQMPVEQPADDDEDDLVSNYEGAPAVDRSGLPWDERIHAKTKATVADGTWRQKRGVDKALVEQVEAELRNRAPVAQQPYNPAQVAPFTQAAPAPQTTPVATMPPAMQPVPMPPALPVQQPDVTQATPMPIAMPAAPSMPVMQAPAAPAAAITPADFMVRLGALMGGESPLVDQDYLIILTNKFNAAYGTTYNAITDAMMNPQHLAQVVQMMQMDGRWS